MCGAYAAINNPFTGQLTRLLDVPNIQNRAIRVPASSIQIVRNQAIGNQLIDAKWWLLLNPDGSANYKYATFNSRSDKLFSSFLTKSLFHTSRCIIPASGFIEGQNKKYHFITAQNNAIALAGIYKQYKINDEIITTASIITCPGGNPKFDGIHKKSIPLMLDSTNPELMNTWLDCNNTDTQSFIPLLTNKINHNLIATPIAKARDLTIIDKPIEIQADV